jgi:hypothetical protein
MKHPRSILNTKGDEYLDVTCDHYKKIKIST